MSKKLNIDIFQKILENEGWIFIGRHAQPDEKSNSLNPSLTELGKRQALALQVWLEKTRAGAPRAIHSGMARARETVERQGWPPPVYAGALSYVPPRKGILGPSAIDAVNALGSAIEQMAAESAQPLNGAFVLMSHEGTVQALAALLFQGLMGSAEPDRAVLQCPKIQHCEGYLIDKRLHPALIIQAMMGIPNR